MVRDADDGVAYLAMGNGDVESKAREAIERLSCYIAGQMGIRPPPEIEPIRGVGAER